MAARGAVLQWTGAIAVAAAVGVLAVSSHARAVPQTRNSAGLAWLASFEQGALLQVNLATGDVVASVRAFGNGEAFGTVQQGVNALAVRPTGEIVKVTGATLRPSAPVDVLPAGDVTRIAADDRSAYIASADGLRVVDAASLAVNTIGAVGGSIDDIAIDRAGTVWTLDAEAATVTPLRDGTLGEPKAINPNGAVTALVGLTEGVAAITASPAALVDVATGARWCEDELRDAQGVLVEREGPAGTVTLLAPDTARVVRLELRSKRCRSVPLNEASGHQLGEPVSSGEMSFVPDYSTGVVHQVDWEHARTVAPTPVARAATTFELRAQDGYLLYNDPVSSAAGVLFPGERKEVIKVAPGTGTQPAAGGGAGAGIGGNGGNGGNRNTGSPGGSGGPGPTNPTPPTSPGPPDGQPGRQPGQPDGPKPTTPTPTNPPTDVGRPTGPPPPRPGSGPTSKSAAMAVSGRALKPGDTLTVEDRSTPRPDSLRWEWGDGKAEDGAPGGSARHRYDRAGSYTVRLTATWAAEANAATEVVTVADTDGAAGRFSVGATPSEVEAGTSFDVTVDTQAGPKALLAASPGDVCTARSTATNGTVQTFTVSAQGPGNCALSVTQPAGGGGPGPPVNRTIKVTPLDTTVVIDSFTVTPTEVDCSILGAHEVTVRWATTRATTVDLGIDHSNTVGSFTSNLAPDSDATGLVVPFACGGSHSYFLRANGTTRPEKEIVVNPVMVTVPDLTGVSTSQATATLQSLGLTLMISEQRPHPTVPQLHVISSDPAAGAKVMKGSTIGVVESNGKAKTASTDFVVPSVIAKHPISNEFQVWEDEPYEFVPIDRTAIDDLVWLLFTPSTTQNLTTSATNGGTTTTFSSGGVPRTGYTLCLRAVSGSVADTCKRFESSPYGLFSGNWRRSDGWVFEFVQNGRSLSERVTTCPPADNICNTSRDLFTTTVTLEGPTVDWYAHGGGNPNHFVVWVSTNQLNWDGETMSRV